MADFSAVTVAAAAGSDFGQLVGMPRGVWKTVAEVLPSLQPLGMPSGVISTEAAVDRLPKQVLEPELHAEAVRGRGSRVLSAASAAAFERFWERSKSAARQGLPIGTALVSSDEASGFVPLPDRTPPERAVPAFPAATYAFLKR